MNTLRLLVVAVILMFAAVMARCAEATLPIAPEKEGYYGSELSADLFTGFATTDFNEDTGFTGDRKSVV